MDVYPVLIGLSVSHRLAQIFVCSYMIACFILPWTVVRRFEAYARAVWHYGYFTWWLYIIDHFKHDDDSSVARIFVYTGCWWLVSPYPMNQLWPAIRAFHFLTAALAHLVMTGVYALHSGALPDAWASSGEGVPVRLHDHAPFPRSVA